MSLRDIASAAGVSSALIIKHFHSKEHLSSALRLHGQCPALFRPPGQLGMTSVLETISAPDNAPYSTIRVLTVTDGGEESLGAIGHRIKEDLLRVLARRIAKEAPHAAPSPDLRAQSAMAVLAGLSFMRRVGDVDFAAFDRTELIDHYAAIVQSIVDGHE